MDNYTINPQTLTLRKAGTVAGTTNTLSFTATPLPYLIRGRHYEKATVTNGVVPLVDFNSGVAFVNILPNQGSVFGLGYDAAGNLRVVQGQTLGLDVTGNFFVQPDGPTTPDTIAMFTLLVVKVGATGSTWTFGTSNFAGATGVTYTFIDVAGPLDRRLA